MEYRTDGTLLKLLRAIVRSRAALAGAIMFVLLFPCLIVSTLIDLYGGIENPYFNLLIYLVLGPVIMLAVILMIVGFFMVRPEEGKGVFTYEALKDQLTIPERYGRIRRLVYASTLLASFFLFILGIAAYSGNRYTESVEFCGTFCHTVMRPQYITHGNSPHSRIGCVECHISKDAASLTEAKLIGMKQLAATLSDTYPRPLKFPVTSLRPSRETCEECHRPETFHGHELRCIDTFLPDEQNSHLETAIIMKIGSGGYLGRSAQGIHWHTSRQHRLFYEAADQERLQIGRVELIGDNGETTTYYKNGKGAPETGGDSEVRLMDCIDCHNRPTHIFLAAGKALDQKILTRQIPIEMPFVKRESLAAVTEEYGSAEEARRGIDQRLRGWYGANYPELTASRPDLLARSIAGAQQAYVENVFPEMNIRWGTYRNLIGHRGCFRCHDGSFRSVEGKVISHECTLCHTIMAENGPVEKVQQMIFEGGWSKVMSGQERHMGRRAGDAASGVAHARRGAP